MTKSSTGRERRKQAGIALPGLQENGERGLGMGFIEEGRQLIQDFVTPEIRSLDVRLTALEKSVESLEASNDKRFTTLDTKVEVVQKTLELKIETVQSTLETKIDRAQATLETKIDKVQATLETKIDKVETKLEKKFDENHGQVMETLRRIETNNQILERLARLESKLQNVA